MKLSPYRAAAIAAALVVMTCNAFAVSFDERWGSLFGVSQISSDTVSAKAEIRLQDIKRKAEKYEPRSRRHRARRGREVRHREWYKGGKKWHYVYSRRRSR